jgi:hypothetical protein
VGIRPEGVLHHNERREGVTMKVNQWLPPVLMTLLAGSWLLCSAWGQEVPQNSPATPEPAAQQKASTDSNTPTVKPRAGKIVLAAGTKLPLVLHNAITTRNARPGDGIYLETLFPVLQDNKIIIPAGSYVQGEILEAKRPGKVKGRGEIRVRLNKMILPNGYAVDFTAVPTNAGTGGNESVENEGKIKGDSDKGGDIGTIAKTTGAGAGIGGLATRTGKGAGIGAGIGAAVGLAAVLLTRGPELELPRGTTLDISLDRALYLDADKIQFTDPGRASTLAGPPNREPQRNRIPF